MTMTYLCAAIFVKDMEQARRDVARAAELGADVVELRIDARPDPLTVAELNLLISSATVPCIVTNRPTWEGGHYEGEEASRLEKLAEASRAGARYIDVELEALKKSPAAAGQDLIVSSHHFQGRPARLFNIVAELNQSPGRINKIVWTASTIRENLEAFELLQQRQKPTIALCMGEPGLISRVLAGKFGAFLTFASLDGSAGTAPGQVSLSDMKRLYRWDSISADTRVYGVVGSPVGHSMSPAIHNAAFEQVGHDGVYLPLLVEPGYESFKAFMETFLNHPGLNLSGLSVTIPHKENALRYLQEKGAEVDPLAERIGALNTIVINPQLATGNSSAPATSNQQPATNLRGFSTDYAAILDSITANLGITRDQLKEYRIAVIGAGGTGRTAVAALAHYGATVVVYNRTRERADELAAEFNGRCGKVVAAPFEKLCDSCCQIYLNTTSVGMHPNMDQTPFGDQPPKFSTQTLVFDTIYNPMRTKLLAHAESCGAATISGVEMFVRQAVGQFEAWTGRPAPVELMRGVVEKRLGR